MNTTRSPGVPISILSLDSGGPGTYSQLLILKEYMNRLAYDNDLSEDGVYPAEVVEWDLAGHFRMTVIEAIDSLFDVVSAVFAEAPRQAPDHESNSRRLRKAIERLINTRGIPLNAKMYEKTQPQPRCKVALYAAASADIAQPYVFRTYSSRGSSLNPTIVDAICATISVPSHFLPTKIMSRPVEHNFVGGPLGANNPTRELLKEADATHGNDGRVTQIISIGGGSSPVLSLDTMGGGGVGRLLVEMAADCQMVAHELAERLFNVESYTRLNSEKSAENIEFGNWDTLGVVETRTRRYTETPNVSNMLDISLKSLRNKVGTITLGRLNQASSIKVMAKTAPLVSPFYVR